MTRAENHRSSSLRLRASGPSDLPAVRELLQEAGLPLEGVEDHFNSFIVADDGVNVVGTIGLELYGETALLRSAVVVPALRNNGLGTRMVEEVLSLARARGVRRLLLLTATAERFFAAHGFRAIRRDTVSGPVTASKEFSGACPSSAVVMQRAI
jgi:amino-acid N-acetyltransferase